MSATAVVEQSWPAEAATVPAARRFVRRYLAEHSLPELADNAELIVTELVSNVVLHVGGSVRVRVVAADDQLHLEVSDDSQLPPLLRSFSATSSTGRGMRLVHSQSAEHGVRVEAQGKTIWVRLTASTADRGDDELAAAFRDVDWLADVEQVGQAGGPTASVRAGVRSLRLTASTRRAA